jgi:PAS domain S-box-containing protein
VNTEDKPHYRNPSSYVRAAQLSNMQLDNAANTMFVVAPSGRFVDANQSACESLGYTRAELLNLSVWHLDEEWAPDRFTALWKQTTVEGLVFFEASHQRKDGTRFPVEISVCLLDSTNGPLMLAVVRDITADKQAEEAIARLASFEEALTRVASYPEQNPNPIIEVNLSGRITYLNPAAQAAFPTLADDGIQHPLLADFEALVAELRKGREDFVTREVSVGEAAYEQKICLVVGTDLVRVFAFDVTKRKRAEERLHREAARVDALARVAARLNAHVGLDSVLKAVCEETACALDTPRLTPAVEVLLYDDAQDALVPGAVFGLPSEYVDEYKPIPRALYDHYAQSQGPLIAIPDLQAIPDLPNAELCSRYDMRTAMVISMMREGRLIGTLNVFSLHGLRTFTAEEFRLLQGLADQAAQAIENARLRLKAEQAAVAAERSRLARDLHDSVTQALYGVTLYAEAAARSLPSGDVDTLAEQLRDIRETAQQALQEMRLLIYELRPLELENGGLPGALRTRLESVEERIGVATQLHVEGEVHLPFSVEEGLYRIAQEGLNNALKHAHAHSITVTLRQDEDTVILEIADDGAGFAPEVIANKGGLGLRGIKERVQKIGGMLEIESQPSQGTKLRVIVRSQASAKRSRSSGDE